MVKITLDKLAQITQDQFARVDEQLSDLKDDVRSLKSDVHSLKAGQERILEVLLEIPTKSVFDRFQVRTETRLSTLEKKAGI